MNQPWVYMCPPSRTPLPPPSPSHPSGMSQCTSFECPVSCIRLGLVIYFTYGNIHELPDVQAGFRKGRETRDQIANIRWIMEKAREFQKNIYFCFIDYAKAFHCVDHDKLCKILQEMGIPDHLICLLRNLYAGQEATIRTGHGTTDWFQIGKGVRQDCILSPCLFNLYAEYIMRNAGLEETQAGIKIAGRNINNLRYADDTHPYGRK